MTRRNRTRWALPSGDLTPGERLVDAVARRTRDTTGVDVFVTGLVGVYNGPEQLSLCFRAHPLSGEPTSPDVRWVDPTEFRTLDIPPETLRRIGHGLADRPLPYLG
ncbi:NUDIX hydrolase [Cryptosporangium phraense]|uniref:NUDIX hydrolase n=2 Tax=Cryptosporangium phraense TaxID=2593070 RepID=A0A545ATF5_9ACTN|nr:NUDIX hydrolase [Cryptosporangium phraense]